MRSWRWRSLLLGVAVLGGLLAGLWQPVDMQTLLAWGTTVTAHPLAMVGVVLLMALLLTLALPGSTCLWLIAPFQPPLVATALLLTGSVLGALGAYTMAALFDEQGHPDAQRHGITALLRQRGDAITQCALRVLPGFPHSILNYGAGLLHLPLPGFIGAATVGLGIKWFVYSSAVHGGVEAVEAGNVGDVVQPETLIPLLVLTLLLLVGGWARYRIGQGPTE